MHTLNCSWRILLSPELYLCLLWFQLSQRLLSGPQDLLHSSGSLLCLNLTLFLQSLRQVSQPMFHRRIVCTIKMMIRIVNLLIQMLIIITQVHRLIRTRPEHVMTTMDIVTLWTSQSDFRIRIVETAETRTRKSWIFSRNVAYCHGISTFLCRKASVSTQFHFLNKQCATFMPASSHSEMAMVMLSPKWTHRFLKQQMRVCESWVIWVIIPRLCSQI